jgi:phenylalanyl-tRNA synthetase beta chain
MKRPDLTPKSMELDVDYVNRLLGLRLKEGEVKSLLERMRYGAGAGGGKVTVRVPAYRADVLHPIDLVEDVAIAYGYMNFKPEVPSLHTLGKADQLELYCDGVRDVMIGLGFREVMTLVLSNRRDLFERMNAPDEDAAEVVKPVSAEQSVARTWLLPSLMVVLEKNRSREYPQRVFEVGDVVAVGGENIRKVAGVIAHSKTNYSEIKAVVSGLLANLKLEAGDEPCDHPSFIGGRCSRNRFGFYGELSPEVLSNFGLEVPATAFELKLM